MNERRPDLSQRRTRIQPPPDEHIDPIDPAPTAEQQDDEELIMRSFRITPETDDLINYVKYRTGKSKRTIVEEAILDHWKKYRSS